MGIVKNLHSAEHATLALNAMGLSVIGVSINENRAVIRVKYCRLCDRLIREGRAQYLSWGNFSSGLYKQGYFDIDKTRIVWSESLH